MLKSEIFKGTTGIDLQSHINQFLGKESTGEIVSVNYAIGVEDGTILYSALIIYKVAI